MQTLNTKHLTNCKFAINRHNALKAIYQPNMKIAEIGVLAGDLSQWFLDNFHPEELHLIDLYNCADVAKKNRFNKKKHEQFVLKRFENEIQNGEVIIKKGISWDIMGTYPENTFDLIYIDAAHDYKSVKKDLASSLAAIKDNGFIVMNDYIMYDHIAKSKYGVVQATNEFCIKHNWEFLYYAFHPNLFCDVVLRKMQ